jgi:23S rRNA pseudouridine1911/1915/1917 synthase
VNQGFEYRSRVGADAHGEGIVEHLARCFARFSRDEWVARVQSGRVLLDGRAAQPQAILRAGQWVSWIRPPWDEPIVPLSFAILYRQADLLAVAKPRGLPTLPGGGQFMDHTLLSLVRRHFPGASPLHRLGRATSGIVLFATAPTRCAIVAQEWRRREVRKVYRALVAGLPAADEFSIRTPIGPVPHPALGTVHAASPAGKPADSHVRVLERRESCALAEVTITTGRPHQIRIHMAAAGHPLVGDPLYGVGGVPVEGAGALPGAPGYHLHAGLLGFSHPVTGAWTEVTCGPPPPLRVSAGSMRALRGSEDLRYCL